METKRPEPIVCPDCGLRNPPGTKDCLACNFPLAKAAAEMESAGIRRPERPRPQRMESQATRLWLGVGAFAAVTVLFIAFKANVERGAGEGAAAGAGEPADHAKQIREMRAMVSQDTNNVEARVALGNLLYDSAHWSEAIVEYRAALARDSSRVPVLVDLGVSYYNAGAPDAAEGYFRHALRLDPHQPVAHFNMGIVYEGREKWAEAMGAFHQALQSDPNDELKQAILQAMQRIQAKVGRPAPPLENGGK